MATVTYSTFTHLITSEVPDVPDPVALSAIARSVREFCVKSHCYVENIEVFPDADTTDDAFPVTVPSNTNMVDVLSAKEYSTNRRLPVISQEQLTAIGYNFAYAADFTVIDYVLCDDTLENSIQLQPYPFNPLVGDGVSIVSSTTDTVTTSGAHGMVDGDIVTFQLTNMSAINTKTYSVEYVSATEFKATGAPTFSPTLNTGHVAQTQAVILKVVLVPDFNATSVDTKVSNPFIESIIAGALAILYAMPGKSWSDPGIATGYMAMVEKAADAHRAKVEAVYSSHARVTSTKYGS